MRFILLFCLLAPLGFSQTTITLPVGAKFADEGRSVVLSNGIKIPTAQSNFQRMSSAKVAPDNKSKKDGELDQAMLQGETIVFKNGVRICATPELKEKFKQRIMADEQKEKIKKLEIQKEIMAESKVAPIEHRLFEYDAETPEQKTARQKKEWHVYLADQMAQQPAYFVDAPHQYDSFSGDAGYSGGNSVIKYMHDIGDELGRRARVRHEKEIKSFVDRIDPLGE